MNEKVGVRGAWVEVIFITQDFDGRGYICAKGFGSLSGQTPQPEAAAWLAGYEFTLQRQEEIRQIDAEMFCLDCFIGGMAEQLRIAKQSGEGVAPVITTGVRLLRTFDRLRSIRAELTRGMSAPRDVQEGRDEG